MPVKSFVGFPVTFSQRLNPLHFLVVFFCAGKKLEQPCLEQLICLGRFFEKFPATRA
jgi:hypothetical protein